MKKGIYTIVFASLVGVALSATAISAAGYGMAGCGLGSIVIGPKGGIIQTFAVTTNATSASQTFGITSGTSNCSESAGAFQQRQQEIFVHVNMKSLEMEMAMGKGEKLNAFAGLLGCPISQMDAFGSLTRKQYPVLSKNMNDPSKLLVAVKTSLKDSTLASSCKAI